MRTLRKIWRQLRRPRPRPRPGLWEAIGFPLVPSLAHWSDEQIAHAQRLMVVESSRMVSIGDAEWLCSLTALERSSFYSAAEAMVRKENVQQAMRLTAWEFVEGTSRAN